MFSGVDVTSHSIFGYFGGVWAFGKNVSAPGPRLKVLGGMGQYDYDATLPGSFVESTIDGDVTLFHVLAGYQWQRGKWTVKTYAGVATEDHDLEPRDPENSVRGSKFGATGQLEVWRNLGTKSFLSFDSSYSTAFEGYFAQGRFGKRVSDRFSLGIEGAALGNQEYESGRGGGFLRLHIGQAEMTISGGLSSDYHGGDIGGYAALGLYGRF